MSAPLRIGVDGRPFGAHRSGVGRYLFELCRALDGALPDASFFVYAPRPVELPGPEGRWTLRTDPSALGRLLPRGLWLKGRTGALCAGDRLDAFLAGVTLLPALPAGVRAVSVVYDLNLYLVPETMDRATRWFHRAFFRRDLLRADGVVAISQGTAQRLERHVGRRADAVALPAVSPHFVPPGEEAVARCLRRLGLARPYLLSVATWEPRKNLELLLEVYLELRREGRIPHALALAGGRGWGDGRLRRRLRRAAAESVHPLGFVADADLPALYAGASAFLFPSRYEGFGMPVLEARACGTPVVATDLPELREAGGPGGIYVPATAEGLRAGILRALEDEAPPVAPGGLPRWEEGARAVAALLAGVVPSP